MKWAVVVVILTCLPYVVAWRAAPAGTQYTWLLVNHYDGESYYAKMQQGARGDWLFHLPFTPEAHDGAFIYTFYLALGHLASISGLPIPAIYHLARIGTGLFLLLVAHRFTAHFFEQAKARRLAFLLLSFSAGFGWILAPLGILLSDLWVAEGFTFLALMVNPHFPLAIGLMLLALLLVIDSGDATLPVSRIVASAAAGLALAVVQPFPVPIVLAVLAAYLGLIALREHFLPWRQAVVAGATALGAAPVILYDLYAYSTNPALSAWMNQNATESLPPWNYALGYGLVLLLALPGIALALRRRQRNELFLLAWLGSAAILLYVPFPLQRRFITGLHVPLVLLATIGIEQVIWPRIAAHRRGLVTGLIVGFSALTNIFVPVVAVLGVAQGGNPLVMSDDEAAAYAWLAENTAWTETVLAPVDSGQFVPAWAGNRVVYGHPFETIDAEGKRAEVERFYDPAATPDERQAPLEQYEVRVVLSLSPELDMLLASRQLRRQWVQGDASIYRVETGR
ncbi:MAG: hypothetical protein M8467_20680 [Anaerolineae bacterium]|nr:hypothetical protein [Anaerolineae bacterium]